MSSNHRELEAIVLAEHISSALSLCGECFVIGTFIFTTKFRKPVNRLIFFATWGNIMGNVASLIARNAIKQLNGRITSPLCNFQAFLEQMFFPADAFFCLCMAINVYLTVIHRYSADQLRRLEPYYIMISYGLPFLIAFPLIFISPKSHGPIYGDAILWCWIRPEYDSLRVGLFYAPVWVIILASLCLYAWTGTVIFQMRSSLRKFANSNSYSRSRSRNAGNDGIQLTTVTQVTVRAQGPDESSSSADPYRCEISGGEKLDANRNTFNGDIEGGLATPKVATFTASAPPVAPPQTQNRAAHNSAMKANRAAWAYARCAMLFFIGLQITWIPSTANRLWPYAHHGKASPFLSIVAACVLPMQGFWNGVIYAATSWSSCVALWADIKQSFTSMSARRQSRRISDSPSTEHIQARPQAVGSTPRVQVVGPRSPNPNRSFASSFDEESKEMS